MQIKISETGEVKDLSIYDQDSGIEWTQDLIGNANAVRSSRLGHDEKESINKGCFFWDDEEGVHIASQSTYDWWLQYIKDHNATAEEARALAKELGIDLAEVWAEIDFYTHSPNDYDTHRSAALTAFEELREQHKTARR